MFYQTRIVICSPVINIDEILLVAWLSRRVYMFMMHQSMFTLFHFLVDPVKDTYSATSDLLISATGYDINFHKWMASVRS